MKFEGGKNSDRRGVISRGMLWWMTYRIAAAKFAHETCTFCPGGDAGIEDWNRGGRVRSGEDVLKSDSYIRGFTDAAREYDDMELIGLPSPSGVYGGTSRSWSTREAFDHFVGNMLDELRRQGPVDGVFLAVHGAMAVRDIPRPEAEMARRFREVVGPEVPIVATFDFHGNEDEAFFRYADMAFATKYYPHFDSREQGERAARYLRRILRGEYHPAKAVRQIPILTPTVVQWTGSPPIMEIMDRTRRWEHRVPGSVVNVFFGFPWSDVPDIGMSVQVMTNGDQERADEIADDMADAIWRSREEWARAEYPQPAEAVELASAALKAGRGRVVLGDYWDRTGDATWTLAALLQAGVGPFLYGCLTDEAGLRLIREGNLQPGDSFEASIGGFMGEHSGEPVPFRGKLLWRGERWGYELVAAVQDENGNTVILVPAYQQIILPEQLRFGPVEPDDYQIFVLKSRVHFRRGFDETGYCPTILLVDAPGDWFGTTRLEHLPYENADPRKFYPYAELGDWRSAD